MRWTSTHSSSWTKPTWFASMKQGSHIMLQRLARSTVSTAPRPYLMLEVPWSRSRAAGEANRRPGDRRSMRAVHAGPAEGQAARGMDHRARVYPPAMASPIVLGRPLTLEELEEVARRGRGVELGVEARGRVVSSRRAIEAIAAGGDEAPLVYGVNTGFGALSETRISAADVRRLQQNLVRSHSTGVGTDLAAAEVRGMMLLRAQVLALGYSGVRPDLIDVLVAMLNAGVHPRVPSQGSVGASGDLAPLAHLALAMIGEGEARLGEGLPMASAEAMRRAGVTPIVLEAKEGLSLINGTQYMASLGTLALLDAERLCRVADVGGAMSLEALKGSSQPFD